MTTRTMNTRARDYASQSRVLRSDDQPIARWSLHLLRKRSRHGGVERRGWRLFVHVRSVDVEIGRSR